MEIQTMGQGGTTVISARGRIDSMTASRLGDALNTEIAAGNTLLVLDLAGVDYMSSAGLRELVNALKKVKRVSGAFTGAYAINPFNNEKIPVWIADYVLAGYGTGAVMAVPGHDERDHRFAKQFNLPIPQVVEGPDVQEEAFVSWDAKIINSGFMNGLTVDEAIDVNLSGQLRERTLCVANCAIDQGPPGGVSCACLDVDKVADTIVGELLGADFGRAVGNFTAVNASAALDEVAAKQTGDAAAIERGTFVKTACVIDIDCAVKIATNGQPTVKAAPVLCEGGARGDAERATQPNAPKISHVKLPLP